MKKIVLLSFTIFYLFNFLKAQDSVAVCPTIEEKEKGTLLNVFPNPTKGTFEITYASTTECPPPGWGGLLVVSVINSNGQIVYKENIYDFEGEYSQTIDLSSYPKGDYVVEVLSGRLRRIKRIVYN